jgi:multicomponent Na+:H+ antiporter subunit C
VTSHGLLRAASAVFGIGVYGLVVADHLMRKLLALNVMGSAVFVVILTVAGITPEGPDPRGAGAGPDRHRDRRGGHGLRLALLVRMFQETGRTSLEGAAMTTEALTVLVFAPLVGRWR